MGFALFIHDIPSSLLLISQNKLQYSQRPARSLRLILTTSPELDTQLSTYISAPANESQVNTGYPWRKILPTLENYFQILRLDINPITLLSFKKLPLLALIFNCRKVVILKQGHQWCVVHSKCCAAPASVQFHNTSYAVPLLSHMYN